MRKVLYLQYWLVVTCSLSFRSIDSISALCFTTKSGRCVVDRCRNASLHSLMTISFDGAYSAGK